MNLHKEIQEIKLKRDQFLKSFAPGEVTTNDIVNASKDIYLQSIRVHKFLTSNGEIGKVATCLLYTSPSPRDQRGSRMPSSA